MKVTIEIVSESDNDKVVCGKCYSLHVYTSGTARCELFKELLVPVVIGQKDWKFQCCELCMRAQTNHD